MAVRHVTGAIGGAPAQASKPVEAPVTAAEIPVLWLTGPAGVGKSTVSWQVFTEQAQAGIRVAFADTDQLCMCYPAPPDDPGRERIKAQNLGAMLPHYQASGAQCVIANGILDPIHGVYLGLLPRAAVTVCRLRADRQEVAARFIGEHGHRSDTDDLVKDLLDEADALDASDFADACVDTTGVPASEVARLVQDRCRSWPGFNAGLQGPVMKATGESAEAGRDVEPRHRAPGAAGSIVLICGPTGVGKSTIGFELYLRYLRAGPKAGYIDLDQIGFLRPHPGNDPRNHRLKVHNLAAMWGTYRAAGAKHVIATGPVESRDVLRSYLDTLPDATVTVCRLQAGPAELTRRIMSRASGGSWPQPGDPLRGKPPEYLSRVAEQAVTAAEALDRRGVGNLRISTDGQTVSESADSIAMAIGRPDLVGD